MSVSAHDYHEGLPGYSPEQLLHDGCGECEARGKDLGVAIGSLDRSRFMRSWDRAAQFGREGLSDVSNAELPLLRVLWALEIKLELRGVPVGTCPGGF